MEGTPRSLITWLQTFGIDAPSNKVSDLSDGVVIAQVLSQIAPDFFTPVLSKIKSETNWRIKVSNMRKVQEGILDFYREVLDKQISGFTMPNLNAIAEDNDINELGRLLQLVLGCAVNCSHKQEYIGRILSLEEQVQHDVMICYQELMTNEIPTGSGFSTDAVNEINEQLKRVHAELQVTKDDRDQITQRCHELDIQVALLQDEKNSMSVENNRLMKELNANNIEDQNTVAGKRFQQMQHKLDILQDEVFKLETVRDELRVKAESHEKEVLDLQQKNEELQKSADLARSLNDELDALKHMADKVSQYESTIESYKKKQEDMGDLKRQMKLLDDKNADYVEKNMELEEELKKMSALKYQAEVYKKQVHEFQSKHSEEVRRADKAEFENKRLVDKYTSLQKDKERLVVEKATLSEAIEDLRCMQLLSDTDKQTKGARQLGSISEADLLDTVPVEIKDKMMRLIRENKILKDKQSSNEERLQSELDDCMLRKNELETENRLANQRILELEGSLQDLQETHSEASSQEGAELRQQVISSTRKMKETQAELLRHKQAAELSQAQCKEAEEKISAHQEALAKKDEEMRVMEERHKKYLEKAKNVYKAMDPSASAGPDVMALRNQLHEKDKIIANLEREAEKSKSISELEERLITTAFYNLGSQMQRRVAEDRLRSSTVSNNSHQTFLSRQRQATSKRMTLPGVATSEFFDH